jgi:predicted dehydrogenase
MADRVAWGVISTAKIGTEKVIPAMQRSERCRIDAIASRDLATAKRVAAELGIPRAYGSYEELLADPAIEAIYNPLPNHLHVPWSIRALEAGKHVLCEKPVAMNAAEAQTLVAARDRTGRLVAEAFMVRQNPQWQRARELARSGALGEVRAIQTMFTYHLLDPANVRNQAEIGGGGLMDIGCYAILTARYIFGAEPLRVAALIDRDPAMRIDRLTSALIEFPGNRHLTFTCSTQLSPHQRVTIMGTKARLEILIPFNAPNDRPCRIVIDDGRDFHGSGARAEEFPVNDQYALQGDVFSRAVRGEAALEFPIEDAVRNMRVIDAAFRAGANGAWEAV